MTPIITNVSERIITSAGDVELLALHVSLTVLLLVLLISKELLQAAASTQSRTRMQAINAVVVPLMMTFGAIVIIRIVEWVKEWIASRITY
jgi:hypothetical protein